MVSGQREPEVFTKAFKLRENAVVGGLGCLLCGVPLAAMAGSLQVLVAQGPVPALGILIPGVVVTTTLFGLVGSRLYGLYNIGLQRDLAAALVRRLGRAPDQRCAYFVGWAPGLTATPKDWEYSHDVGFLSVAPDRMAYTGDALDFELPRQQVCRVTLGRHGADRHQRVCVEWLDEYCRPNAFTFVRRDGQSKAELDSKTGKLGELLQEWRQFGTVPPQHSGADKAMTGGPKE